MNRLGSLALGLTTLLIANGHTIAPFATAVSAFLVLHYLDGPRPGLRLAIAAPLFIVAQWFVWFGIIPLPGLLYYAVATIYGAAHFLPYVAHRLARTPGNPFISTLAFPAAYVLIEAALETWTPYGSWTSVAYTQDPGGGLGQLAAIGGTAAVTFGLTWLASIAVWLWSRRADGGHLGAIGLTTAIALTGLSLAPVLRVRMFTPSARIVHVAGLLPDMSLQRALARAMSLAPERPSDAAVAAAAALNSDLIARTRAAAQRGAQVVVWSETAARVVKRDEKVLLEELSRAARENGVFLFAAYGAFDPHGAMPFQNRVAAFAPRGDLVWIYDKAHPIVGSEADSVAAGAARLPVLDTPFGRVGLVICHDADFPNFVRQAHADRVDLLINPADDWPAIETLHANMARFRAVENGVTLLRIANGVSIVADPVGRLVAQRNNFRGDEPTFSVAFSVRRGASFASRGVAVTRALAALLLALIAALAMRANFRSRTN